MIYLANCNCNYCNDSCDTSLLDCTNSMIYGAHGAQMQTRVYTKLAHIVQTQMIAIASLDLSGTVNVQKGNAKWRK